MVSGNQKEVFIMIKAIELWPQSANSRNNQDRGIQVKYFNEIRKQYIL